MEPTKTNKAYFTGGVNYIRIPADLPPHTRKVLEQFVHRIWLKRDVVQMWHQERGSDNDTNVRHIIADQFGISESTVRLILREAIPAMVSETARKGESPLNFVKY